MLKQLSAVQCESTWMENILRIAGLGKISAQLHT